MTKITPLEIEGVYKVEGQIFHDNRGSFQELLKFSEINKISGELPWVQSNLSISKQNTIRGIHFSKSPFPQNKLVNCIKGEITDLVVDLRPMSNTYKKFCAIELDENSATAVFIPSGLGHAFIARVENSIVNYLLTSEYNPESEFVINPFDPEIAIDWGVTNYIISEKDRTAPNLSELVSKGIL
jgi:dTDP-4-dehydrorhamnose 3,5-epimerase